MVKSNRLKKGFTLIELTVVLSVVAIISVMVISFSSLTAKKVGQTTGNLNYMQDVVLVDSLVDSWVEKHLSAGSVITVQDGTVVATNNGIEHGITFQNGKLVGKLVSGNLSVTPEHINALSFELATPNASGEIMLFCTAKYTLDGQAKSYVFTINPHVNDVIRGDGNV